MLILPAALVLLLGIPAAFMTVPLEGGVGGPYYEPTSMGELEDHYQLAFGKLTLDLTQLPVSTEPITVEASVGAGGLQVIVPDDAQIQVDTQVGPAAPGYWARARAAPTSATTTRWATSGASSSWTCRPADPGGIEVDQGRDNRLELDYGVY